MQPLLPASPRDSVPLCPQSSTCLTVPAYTVSPGALLWTLCEKKSARNSAAVMGRRQKVQRGASQSRQPISSSTFCRQMSILEPKFERRIESNGVVRLDFRVRPTAPLGSGGLRAAFTGDLKSVYRRQASPLLRAPSSPHPSTMQRTRTGDQSGQKASTNKL